MRSRVRAGKASLRPPAAVTAAPQGIAAGGAPGAAVAELDEGHAVALRHAGEERLQAGPGGGVAHEQPGSVDHHERAATEERCGRDVAR